MKCFFISILYFTIFSYYVSTCKALDVYQFIDTKAYSMGNTFSVLPGFANPASHGFVDARYVTLQYANRFGVKELSTYAGSVNVPNKYLNAGLYISRFGFDAYHETSISLNLYRKLSDFISLGVRINYLNLRYSDKEPSKSMVSADIGVLVQPIEHLRLSVLAINPLRTDIKIGGEKSEIPVILLVGASYEVGESFLLTAEVEKDFKYPFVCKFGMEYSPIQQLSIRAGIYGKPFTPTFGVGINIRPFVVDIAFSRHPVLGFSSYCGLRFDF